jgi:hypothetical protein
MKTLKFFALIAVAASMLMGQAALASPPSWDTVINSKGRFKVLRQFDNTAVLDHETGLVWERSPSTDHFQALYGILSLAVSLHCNNLTTGGRKGWRLPTLQELSSLVDPSRTNPSLPPDHPFINVQAADYWSSTRVETTEGLWGVEFSTGNSVDYSRNNSLHIWCVRGGQGVDPQ